MHLIHKPTDIYAYTHMYNHTAETQNENKHTKSITPLNSLLGFSDIRTKCYSETYFLHEMYL